jgi:hypothetical protein
VPFCWHFEYQEFSFILFSITLLFQPLFISALKISADPKWKNRNVKILEKKLKFEIKNLIYQSIQQITGDR